MKASIVSQLHHGSQGTLFQAYNAGSGPYSSHLAEAASIDLEKVELGEGIAPVETCYGIVPCPAKLC